MKISVRELFEQIEAAYNWKPFWARRQFLALAFDVESPCLKEVMGKKKQSKCGPNPRHGMHLFSADDDDEIENELNYYELTYYFYRCWFLQPSIMMAFFFFFIF